MTIYSRIPFLYIKFNEKLEKIKKGSTKYHIIRIFQILHKQFFMKLIIYNIIFIIKFSIITNLFNKTLFNQ